MDTTIPKINTQNLELNVGDQMIVAIDISASMQAKDCPLGAGGISRIAYVLETLPAFLQEAQKYDPDGVSIYTFGQNLHAFPDVQADKFAGLLAGLGDKLEGTTNTHLAITAAYAEHKKKKSDQTFLFLFTDGDPADKNAVEQAIVKITQDVKDETEFRIGFILVGETPPSLDSWLNAVDADLQKKGAKYDIVSCGRLEKQDFITAVCSALAGKDTSQSATT